MLKQEIATRLQQKINSPFSQCQREFQVLAQAILADAARSKSPPTPALTFTSIYKHCEVTIRQLRDILQQAVIDILYMSDFEPTDEFALLLKKEVSSKLHPLSNAFAQELRAHAGKLGVAETMDLEYALQQAVGIAVDEIRSEINSRIQSRRKDEEKNYGRS